jgi:hypothetical protein
MKWHEDYLNVVALGEHLCATDAVLTVAELQRYYEKPWKWAEEWLAFTTLYGLDQTAWLSSETGATAATPGTSSA